MFAFSPSQEHFAAVTADGRLKIWNVDSNAIEQELKERDHLSCKYTAIAWTLRSPMTKPGKRSKAGGRGLIALGTSAGTIVVWDLQKGEVVQRLPSERDADVSASSVNDVAFNAQGSLLYSCSKDKVAFEWNVKDGSVIRKFRCGGEGANKLAVSADDETLAIGGTAIRLYDLTSGKRTRKLVAGLSSAVNQLHYSRCKRFLFSATVGGRYVNMYDLQADGDEPAVIFSLPSNPSCLFVRSSVGKKKADVMLGAVASGGSLFVWRHKHKLLTRSTHPVAPDVTSVGADGRSPGVLLATDKDEDEQMLRVVRGSIVQPVFEAVSILDEHKQLRTTLEFAPISDHLLLDESSASQKRQRAEAAAATEKTQVPTLSDRSGMAAGSRAVDVSMGAVDDQEDDGEEEEGDVPLAERLEALRERLETDLEASIAHASADDVRAAGDKERPDASSLASLLEQALQARDNAMLEYCLRTRDAKVIRTTIQRVSSVKVLALLEIIVLKFEKSPARSARLCPWIRAILLHHTAFLAAQPDLVRSLSGLYQILEQRLKVNVAMHKLAGKLSLVLGQISDPNATATAVDGGENSSDKRRAAIVYQENEEDDEDEAEDDEEEDDDAEEQEQDDGEEEDDDGEEAEEDGEEEEEEEAADPADDDEDDDDEDASS